MKSYIWLLPFILISCASYVDEMHKSFDRADRKTANPKEGYDQFSFYRNQGQANQFNNNPNTARTRYLNPSVQRQYQSRSVAKKRFKAEDLTDNGNDASLWSSDENTQFLFAQATDKKLGEIILINVNNKLKNSITAELKRAFPDPPPMPVRKPDEQQAGADATAQASNQQAPTPTPEPEVAEDESSTGGSNKIYDRISSVIIERINKNHLLIKGRKTLLYKRRKRTIEVQALISKRNINGDDSVDSDEILESSVRVIR